MLNAAQYGLYMLDGRKLFGAVFSVLLGIFIIANAFRSSPQGMGWYPGQVTEVSPRTARIVLLPLGVAVIAIGLFAFFRTAF